jgi:hypothetical protein
MQWNLNFSRTGIPLDEYIFDSITLHVSGGSHVPVVDWLE